MGVTRELRRTVFLLSAVVGAVTLLGLGIFDYAAGTDQFENMNVRAKHHVEAWTETKTEYHDAAREDGRKFREAKTTTVRHPEQFLLYTAAGNEVAVTRQQWAITNVGQDIVFGRKIGRLTGATYGWHYITEKTSPE